MHKSNKKSKFVARVGLCYDYFLQAFGTSNIYALPETDITHCYDQTADSLADLKSKYAPSYDYSESPFEEDAAPVISESEIKAGVLREEVIADTIKQINYFREVYGLQPVTTVNTEANENAGGWAVAQAAAGCISHDVDSLKDKHPALTSDFLTPLTYRNSPTAIWKISLPKQ